jgi:protein-tyrosine kinase
MTDFSKPDLVQRAAERLSGATTRKPVGTIAEGLGRVMAPAVETATIHAPAPSQPLPLAPPPVGLGRGTVEPQKTIPIGREVTISAASLAMHGIYLPSAGFLRPVEEFRIIKRQVLVNASRNSAITGNDLNRVIMVTSSKPGEGKTYTAINLALSIAYERDVKVLLVDADGYRQSMLKYLGIESQTGWLDLLANPKLGFSDVLLRTNIPNLNILPAGKSHSEVPELMASRKMGNMMTEMVRRYSDRIIIFDTLPCLVSSEPVILSSLVGQTIFVVAASDTSRSQVESSLRLISSCPSVSLVLNKADPHMSEQFGKYGYGYGHRNEK